MDRAAILQNAIAAFQRGDVERARALAEEAERAGPTADLHHLLGLIDCRSGRLESGIGRLRSACEADPANIGFRLMLARALTDADRPQEALEVAAPPVGRSPAELALWQARGEAALAAGNNDDAAEAWGVLCDALPNEWRVWANSGEALAKTARWPEATTALARAAELQPGETSLRQNLASALANAGRHEEAIAELVRLLEQEPDGMTSRLTLARLQADLGRNQEAAAQLEIARQRSDSTRLIDVALGTGEDREFSKDELRSVRELALLLERTNRIDELRALLDDAARTGVPAGELAYPAAAVALRDGDHERARILLEAEPVQNDPMRWHRLMARIAEARGDPAAAFAEAEVMNRSVQDHDRWVERGDDFRRSVRTVAATVTDAWAKRLRPVETGKRKSPAFLVGFPRSGTTLLDTFLMGHPDIDVLEEIPTLTAAQAILGPVADLPDRSPGDLARAREAYFAELGRHADSDFAGLVIDKLPLNMLAVAEIYSLFPDARIIFGQRHPCDCVLSNFMQSFALNDAMASFLTIDGAADLYDAALSAFTRSSDVLPVAVHTLVYEDLVQDPQGTLKPLIDFLGLEWKPEILDHRATAKGRGAISTPSYDQVTEKLNDKAIGRWRRYEKQLEPVLPILLPWAERLGYRN